MILLDTHAVIWLAQGHRRGRPLNRYPRLYISPATGVLEIQFLSEAGRVRLAPGVTSSTLMDDDRWVIDDPPAARWFGAAAAMSWTRDPFDRLLAAHARLRSWKLATADALLIAHLEPAHVLPL